MDNRKTKIKIVTMIFTMALIVIAGIFVASIIKTDLYNKSTQFDPKIADVFLKLIKGGKI